MIIHKHTPLLLAARKQKKTDAVVAAMSNTSLKTAKKILEGGVDIQVRNAEKIAALLGFDLEIRYVPRKEGATA